MDITQYPVSPPKIVAIAKEPGLSPKYKFADRDLPGPPPEYGEDLTFGVNGVAPNGEDVGSTESELKPKMLHLLDYFAEEDHSGMALRLFSRFLAKQSQVTLFTDKDLDKAADAHENIQYFCRAALGFPIPAMGGIPPAPGKTRIHQALQAAKWDINKLVAPTDLGAPAFNLGDKAPGWFHQHDATGDWANGLGVMIDAVQYVFVIVTHYHYDQAANFYGIKLKYMGYDVFGLDNADIDKYGAQKDDCTFKRCDMGVGITAWWQLQHQHAYAPLVTRFVVERTFEYPAI
jgi:hypothetical protein